MAEHEVSAEPVRLNRQERAARLERVLGEEMAKPYVSGVSDCFFLGLAVVDDLRGTALRDEFEGSYQTLFGAQRELRRRGHVSLVTLLEELGLERIPAGRCDVGDIAVVGREVEHIAVFTGSGFASRTEEGPAIFRHRNVLAAFRV